MFQATVLFLLLLPKLYFCLCHDAASCITRIRKIAAEPRHYWFGEQWRDSCTGRYIDRINCYNPEALQTFHSLGSRLFRVKTYQNEYLKNLRIFPTISYRSVQGMHRYRACDHDFVLNGTESVIEVNPDMEPVKPYDVRYAPDLQWTGIYNHSYLIVAIDVGFGTLNYLAVRSPSGDKVFKEYVGSENFRHQPNPVVFLIFETSSHIGPESFFYFESENFDLPKFMIDYGLENGLIGMNILPVTTDAYAIEKQRLRGIADNCHSLIIQRIQLEKPWQFMALLPLREISNWVSVSFEQPDSTVELCCHKFALNKQMLVMDPLGDKTLPSIAVRKEPRITAMKNVPTQSKLNNNGFQRNIRNHIDSVIVDRYSTLVLFDAESGFLYWMIVDIPSVSLSAGDVHDGNTIVPYLAPIPRTPNACTTAVLLLLTQPPSALPSTVSKFYKYNPIFAGCEKNCSQRKLTTSSACLLISEHLCDLKRSQFDITQFKSLHQLQLSAMNWLNTCYDVYEAADQQRRQRQQQQPQKTAIANITTTTTNDTVQYNSDYNRHQMDPFSGTDNRHSGKNLLYNSYNGEQASERYHIRRHNSVESRNSEMDFCSPFGLTEQRPCYQQLVSAATTANFHRISIFASVTICYLIYSCNSSLRVWRG